MALNGKVGLRKVVDQINVLISRVSLDRSDPTDIAPLRYEDFDGLSFQDNGGKDGTGTDNSLQILIWETLETTGSGRAVVYHCNHTIDEILAAVDAGKSPIAYFVTNAPGTSDIHDKVSLSNVYTDHGHRKIEFCRIDTDTRVYEGKDVTIQNYIGYIMTDDGIIFKNISQEGYDYISKYGSGADGKSAYEYAKEAGYTGTETEFGTKLNQLLGLTDGNEVSY